jgi:carbamoyl-phosphate synthase large subunit
MSLEKVHSLTGIDTFFLSKIKNVIDTEQEISQDIKTRLLEKNIPLLKQAKKQGFSDKQIELITGIKEENIRKFRFSQELLPYVKQIDTLG